MQITDIHNPWRDALLPASFQNCPFFVEANSIDSGRRIVEHEFPKKNIPYAEDMGRRAYGFTVRAYCIAYVYDYDTLFQRDYRVPRDLLRAALDAGGAGYLQLPTYPAQVVTCQRYRLTEEERFGGYCVFDIMFVEQGQAPTPVQSSQQALLNAANVLSLQMLNNLTPPPATSPSSQIPL